MWPCDPVVFSLIDSSSLKPLLGRHKAYKLSHFFLMMWLFVLFWKTFLTATISCFLDLFLSLFISHITSPTSCTWSSILTVLFALVFYLTWQSEIFWLCSFSCDYQYCSTLLTSQWCVYFHIFSCTRQGNITSPSSLCWDINLRLWVMSHYLAAGCTTAKHNKLYFISHTHAFTHNY